VDIEDPEDTLGIEGGAGNQNNLFSNVLINSDSGLMMDLDQH
jgi:hypothetical protein